MAEMPRPLRDQLTVTRWSDREMRRIARLASQEAERIVRTSGTIRSAQISLAAQNVEMWAGVGSATEEGIERAVKAAKVTGALFDKDLIELTRISQSAWRASQLATAQEGIQSLISRKENGITLSQRVWRNSQVARRGLEETINVGLALGKSQKEIAADVKKYISPNAPGGSSYAAMRLGRTEVANAYHTTNIRKYSESPWIDRVRWVLSGSHPRPDECNEYAEGGNLKNGLWSPDQIPAKPHPNCLCYMIPEQMDLEAYAKKYEAGDFDDYIDEQMSHI